MKKLLSMLIFGLLIFSCQHEIVNETEEIQQKEIQLNVEKQAIADLTQKISDLEAVINADELSNLVDYYSSVEELNDVNPEILALMQIYVDAIPINLKSDKPSNILVFKNDENRVCSYTYPSGNTIHIYHTGPGQPFTYIKYFVNDFDIVNFTVGTTTDSFVLRLCNDVDSF